ncbi:leucine-rich repeat-containing protein 15-like [Littorina saxatilis]|uniref:Uncharacterized protein n=1 Tax=Littorina saxatilis TaxID=31220 RepID=A0AAN9BZ88_9CAEN
MSGRRIIIFTLLSLLHLAAACPENCQCQPEGRGQQVTCTGGELGAIMAGLPHNTARLTIDGLTSTHVLAKADMQRSASASIHQLTISNSAVQTLEDNIFGSTLASLQLLDLSGNSIGTIEAGVFTGLSGLRSLNLSSNSIIDLGQALEPLVSLQRLDLSNNHIDDLKSSTFQTQSNLNYLRLDGNKNIRMLTGAAFQPLSFLSELKVRNCGIFAISDDFLESVKRIRLMDLGDNRLTKFPSSTVFNELQQLKYLYLDGNELLNLVGSQFHDLSLVVLRLSRNRISAISADVFTGLMVEDLDLSENKLLELKGETLQPVAPHLASLNIANNPIRVLHPETFESLHSLETLNISACSLSVIPAKVLSSLHSLNTLDASWNHLQNISEDIIKILKRLRIINLQQNSWLCDCHIMPFRDWLRSRSSIHKLYCLPGRHTSDCSDLKCMAPDELVGERIANLADSEVEQCGASGFKSGLPVPIQISIVLACLLFSLGMLLVTLYLWRRGRTKKELRQMFVKKRKPDSHDDVAEEENQKIDPFENCDNESLKESHRSFVFRNYFDQMVTDPKLLEPTSPSQVAPSESHVLQKDSVYSSNPSLYEASHNSHSIVVGIESAV